MRKAQARINFYERIKNRSKILQIEKVGCPVSHSMFSTIWLAVRDFDFGSCTDEHAARSDMSYRFGIDLVRIKKFDACNVFLFRSTAMNVPRREATQTRPSPMNIKSGSHHTERNLPLERETKIKTSG